jgi:hypothetical protein
VPRWCVTILHATQRTLAVTVLIVVAYVLVCAACPRTRSPPWQPLATGPELEEGGAMPKKLRLGGFAALLLALLRLPAAAAPSAARSSDDGDVDVIRVTEITVQDNSLDLGESGDSVGDEFIFSGDLFRGGEKVGIDAGSARSSAWSRGSRRRCSSSPPHSCRAGRSPFKG